MKKKIKKVKVYMCAVDWQHEIGHAAGGNRVFATEGDLKKHLKCWPQCGIVEVEVKMVRWVSDQDFSREIKDESEQSSSDSIKIPGTSDA